MIRATHYQSLFSTATSEFLARGILWVRVLLLGALMPLHDYGLILVYLGIEGLIAATTSYPFVKDILVRQDLSDTVYLRFTAVFALVAGPIALLVVAFAETGPALTVTLLAAAFLNALAQIGLCTLRVADIAAHNRTKILWSILTTLLFLALLPLAWAWLPAVYLFGAALVLGSARRAVRKNATSAAFESTLAYHVRGWLIYGSQALLTNFPQYGVRLFVAATMTLADVAQYTQVYMLATALFFVYSAMMVTVEPGLTRAAPAREIRKRLPLARKVSALFVAVALGHYVLLNLADTTGVLSTLLGVSMRSHPLLTVALMVFTAANGVQVVANALVLAVSGRVVSLLSTVVGSLVVLSGLALSWSAPSLVGIGVALAAGQLVALTLLLAFLYSRVVVATRNNHIP